MLNHIFPCQKPGIVLTFLEAAYFLSNPAYDHPKALVLFHIICCKISSFLIYCIPLFVLAHQKYPLYGLTLTPRWGHQNIMTRNKYFRASPLRFKPQLYSSLAKWPWASNLKFLICETRIKWDNTCKVDRRMDAVSTRQGFSAVILCSAVSSSFVSSSVLWFLLINQIDKNANRIAVRIDPQNFPQIVL